MKPTVLVGPAPVTAAAAFANAFREHGMVDRADDRATFRRAVAANDYGAIVLFDLDRTGMPTEPLLHHCIDATVACPVVCVLTLSTTRIPSAAGPMPDVLTYYPLDQRSGQADYAALALYVKLVCEGLGAGHRSPSARSPLRTDN